MLFKNETDKPVKVRTGPIDNYLWKTIRPGQKEELPEHIGLNAGLSIILEVEQEQVKLPEEEPEYKGSEKEIEEKLEYPEGKEYKKFLTDIKGVGPKSAEDIMNDYSTFDNLVVGIALGNEIHNNDRVDSLVKQKVEEFCSQ